MERRQKDCMLCVDVGVWESENHNSGFWKMMIMVFVLKMKKGDLKGKKRRGSVNLGRRSFFRTNPFYWEKERVINGCSNYDVVSFSNFPKTFLTTITTNRDVVEFSSHLFATPFYCEDGVFSFYFIFPFSIMGTSHALNGEQWSYSNIWLHLFPLLPHYYYYLIILFWFFWLIKRDISQ